MIAIVVQRIDRQSNSSMLITLVQSLGRSMKVLPYPYSPPHAMLFRSTRLDESNSIPIYRGSIERLSVP